MTGPTHAPRDLFRPVSGRGRHTGGMSAPGSGSSSSSVDIVHLVSEMRRSEPLVHCLTNSVVRQITADVLLAAGAAPAMVDHPEEAADFAAVASGVLVNVGNPTAEQVEGMHAAIGSAREHGTPWVLDPVAVGGLTLRTGLATGWLDHVPAAIRANASEIVALAGTGAGGRGVDSTHDVAAALPSALMLAERTGGVVAVTGAQDVVVTNSGGLTVATWITSGHPLLQKVIGTGCALGALTAAYLGAARAAGLPDHDAVVAAHAHVGAAGTAAGRVAAGPGLFAVAWLDALYTLTPGEIADSVTLLDATP
ncbi:hydroxyethylthiazole kinase [Dietzia cercidiphylli]|uniref:Hydroxyethylthiazole kinase n=3 Tax=Dietzia cercidiphylli TaxID=498199 RepID=A0ABN2IUN7_9ACTN